MGSNGTRIALLAAAVVAAVALFVVLSSGGDDEPSTTSASTTSTTTQSEPPKEKEPKEKPKPKPEPEVPTVEVKDGQPVGGVQELEFEAGGEIEFNVTSNTDMEFHFHGYDVEQGVSAGGTTTFKMPADIEGVFELEEHDLGTLLAEITVSPN